jgi:hypothetical protein
MTAMQEPSPGSSVYREALTTLELVQSLVKISSHRLAGVFSREGGGEGFEFDLESFVERKCCSRVHAPLD